MEYQNSSARCGPVPEFCPPATGARWPAPAAPSFPKPPSRRSRASPPASVPGVYSLGSGPSRALGAFRDAVGSSDHAAGVRAEVGETQVAVDIDLVALYGTPLHALADQIRAAVYAAVEELVGLQVIEVNIEIIDVYVPGPAKPGHRRPRPGRQGRQSSESDGSGNRRWAPSWRSCPSSSARGASSAPCSSWAIGALLGRAAEGKLDLRSVLDALTGRRSSS